MRSEASVTRKDKFIAWFLIAQATAGFMLLAWLLWRSGSLPLGVWITFLPLAVLALAAGLGSLSGKRWGGAARSHRLCAADAYRHNTELPFLRLAGNPPRRNSSLGWACPAWDQPCGARHAHLVRLSLLRI